MSIVTQWAYCIVWKGVLYQGGWNDSVSFLVDG